MPWKEILIGIFAVILLAYVWRNVYHYYLVPIKPWAKIIKIGETKTISRYDFSVMISLIKIGPAFSMANGKSLTVEYNYEIIFYGQDGGGGHDTYHTGTDRTFGIVLPEAMNKPLHCKGKILNQKKVIIYLLDDAGLLKFF